MYVRPQLFLPPARGDRIGRKTEEQKRETTRKSCENEGGQKTNTVSSCAYRADRHCF